MPAVTSVLKINPLVDSTERYLEFQCLKFQHLIDSFAPVSYNPVLVFVAQEMIDPGLVLSDKDIFPQGRNLPIVRKLLTPVISLSRWRRYFDDHGRIHQSIIVIVFQHRSTADNDNIGIRVEIGRIHAHPKRLRKHVGILSGQKIRKHVDQVGNNPGMTQAAADHDRNLTIVEFVLHFRRSLSTKVVSD